MVDRITPPHEPEIEIENVRKSVTPYSKSTLQSIRVERSRGRLVKVVVEGETGEIELPVTDFKMVATGENPYGSASFSVHGSRVHIVEDEA